MKKTIIGWVLSIIAATFGVAAGLAAFYYGMLFLLWLPGQFYVIAIFGGLILNIASGIKRDWFPDKY